MHELINQVNKELEQVQQQGINTNNLQMLGQLVDIQKDLYKIESMKNGSRRDNYSQGGNGGSNYSGYGRENYNRYSNNYGRNYSRGGDRLYEYYDQISDGIARYQEGRSSYGHNNEERLKDGLDRLMFGVSMLVETAMEFAETQQEREIIHHHLQKIKNI